MRVISESPAVVAGAESHHHQPLSGSGSTSDHSAAAASGCSEHPALRTVPQAWGVAIAAVAVVAQASAVAVPEIRSMGAFLASCDVLAVVISLALVLPRFGGSVLGSASRARWVSRFAGAPVRVPRSRHDGIAATGAVADPPGCLYHRPGEINGADPWRRVRAHGHFVARPCTRRGHRPDGCALGVRTRSPVARRCQPSALRADAIGEREEALRQAHVLGEVARELNSTLDPAGGRSHRCAARSRDWVTTRPAFAARQLLSDLRRRSSRRHRVRRRGQVAGRDVAVSRAPVAGRERWYPDRDVGNARSGTAGPPVRRLASGQGVHTARRRYALRARWRHAGSGARRA